MDLPHDLPTENTENTHSNSNIWGLSKKIWAEMGCQFGNPVRLVMFSVQPSGGSLNSKKNVQNHTEKNEAPTVQNQRVHDGAGNHRLKS